MYLGGVRTVQRVCVLLCAVVLLLALAPAGWALVPRMDLPALVDRSQAVIVGTVTGKRSRWEENGGMIYTYVTVRVEEVVAGAVGRPVITIKCPGGTVGDITCEVSDVPSFSVGERAILFLRDEFFNIVGWHQGKKPIRNGRVVGERMSATAYSGLIRGLARRGRPRVRTGRGAGPLIVESAVLRAPRGRRVGLRQTPGALGIGPLAPDVLMSDNFEGAWPGAWTQYGNPTWGKDDYKPHGGTYSVWCARDGAAGRDPATQNYANNMNAWMVYGPFDLSTYSSASLDFYFWLYSQSGSDFFAYAASPDDVDYYGYLASGNSGGWVHEQLDLTDYLGDPTVWIAFIFQSNNTVTFKGAFVDDVSIVAETGGAVINSITPDEESAGTDTEVTIDGQDFGASQGTSEVQFYYVSGEPNKVANIVSWSDTEIVCTVPQRASSGPVTVVTPAGTSNGYPFTVTFGYLGRRWPDPPVPSYEIYENTTDCAGEGAAIQAAANEWNAWTSGTDFEFSYAGSTSRAYGYDGHNILRWNNNIGGAIGICTTWYTGSTILECDVRFEDNFDWATDPVTPGGSYDVQTIALHEMGHWLSLADLYGGSDSGKVMYGFGSTGQQKRETVAEDRLGLNWIYSEPTIASLSSFSAALVGRIGALVEFDWLDPREVVGFELHRRSPAMPAFERTRTLWSEPNRQHYRILDPSGRPGMMYQVRSIYPDGRRQRHGSIVARPAF